MTGERGECSKGGTILIVEDDRGLAELIRLTLEENGFACRHASTGRDALAQLGDSSPVLMLLDYSLPDMTGVELVTSVGRQSLLPPFIMITGREDTRLAVSIMKHGARDYLVKDVEFLDRLPSVVTRVTKEAETEKRLKEAEKALKDSEARLAKAQQIARMGSWEWNPVSGKMFCSEGMYRLLGVPPRRESAIMLEWLSRRVDSADLDRARMAFEALKETGKPLNMDCRVTCEDGSEIVVNCQGEIDLDSDGTPGLLSGTLLDITERKRAENEIQQLAYYDMLTGLPNRTLLLDRLSQAIAQAHRDGRLVAVLFLDLDRFKSINDTLGHLCGDLLLKAVAKRLLETVRESDSVARIGGDEFVIVLTAIAHEDDVSDIAGKILAALSAPVQLGNHEIFTTASIGISLFPMDGDDVHALLKNADVAMYKAKEQDRNNYQFFSIEMNIKVVERLMLETSMRKALDRSELSLRYQPQVDLSTGRLIGVEALIRWQHADLGRITTDTFIPLAEETGLILSIGEWVLSTACAQNRAWQDAGFAPFRVAVNLSARQFKQKNLVETIERILAESRLDPQYLELELTESTIMGNAEEAVHTLRRLKEMGISLAIDDFGTGYSSLSYLKYFSIDRLKVDRSFVRDISVNADDAAITTAVIAMGHSLNLKVIAEGVELEDQLDFLRSRGCDEVQGFLLSRPLRAEALTELLKMRRL